MPITRFIDLTVSREIAKEADDECFPEISAFHLSKDSFSNSFPVLIMKNVFPEKDLTPV